MLKKYIFHFYKVEKTVCMKNKQNRKRKNAEKRTQISAPPAVANCPAGRCGPSGTRSPLGPTVRRVTGLPGSVGHPHDGTGGGGHHASAPGSVPNKSADRSSPHSRGESWAVAVVSHAQTAP